MKAIMLSTCVFLISLAPYAVYGYSVDLEYGWTPSDIQVTQKAGYDYLAVEGAVNVQSSLSTLYEVRLLPQGYRVVAYEVLGEEWEEIAGTYRLGTQTDGVVARMMGDDMGGVEFVGDVNVHGYKVLLSALKPVRVIDGRVSVLKNLRIRVECGPDVDGLRAQRRSFATDRHLRTVLGAMLGEAVGVYGDWELEGYRDWVSEGPSLSGGVVDCVIVTADSMAGEFERLAAWHDRLGVRTVVRTMTWIESSYLGSDRPERVRNFLKEAYEKWGTVYVVLGGAPPVVPIRYGWAGHYGGASIPTDVYYGNLDGNWNEDGDDVFGEFGEPPAGDGVTWHAHLITGRAPVLTVAEAGTFVDKAISYTTEPDSGFPASALFLGEVIFPVDWKPGDDITLDGRTICDTAAAYFPSDFDTLKLYQYWGDMTRTSCLQAMNEGYNYTIIAGHGDAFRVSAADGDPPFILSDDFDTLSNHNRCGFVYALNCNNLAVDVDCVFRHMLLNPSGGATATYATTRYDFPNVGQFFLNEFLGYVFQRGVTRLGDACALHHLRFIPTGIIHDGAVRWSLLTYMLAGDPVVRLWVDEPGSLDVTASGEMSLGDSVFTVEVSDGGVGVEGAVVVLIGDRGEYGVGVTGSGGLVEVDYRPRGLGWVELVVSGDGYLMYEDSVEVVGGGGRCYVRSVVVDDGFGWTGNDDGEAGWGERVGLGVGLVNGGSGTLSGVSCDVSVVAGCSLYVVVEIDSIRSDSVVYVGREGGHPGSMPFGLGLSDGVIGHGLSSWGNDLGCWIWLDGMGWHVRFVGEEAGSHTYVCSLSVYGELLGYRGVGLESGDVLAYTGGLLVMSGSLALWDYEDGLDLVVGDSLEVEVYAGHADYGEVGGSEVVGWYDVGFGGGGVGDGLGVWFEASISDGVGGSWRDWFRLLVHDGEVRGERLSQGVLSGDTLRVFYGVRNVGSGGLLGLEGRLRGLSGVEVYDSVSVYGEVVGGGYVEGDGYTVRELGGSIRYEVYLFDTYGRHWRDTVDVRTVGVVGDLSHVLGSDYVALSWQGSSDSLLLGYDVYRSDTEFGSYGFIGMVEGYSRYVDDGLASEESYYYYVCARDSMGNVSVPSETLEVWTGPPYLDGWPATIPHAFPSSPVLADVDGNGDLEVIVGAKDWRVYMWEHDGTLSSGWPRVTTGEIWSSAAAADLDADGELEIVIGSDDGCIYAWNADGTGYKQTSGLFKSMGGYVRGAPAIDDIDDDLDLEIIAANSYGQVYVWHHDGTGYLLSNGLFAGGSGNMVGSPTIADLDDDGDVELIFSSMGGNIYAWHHDGTGYLESTGVFASPGAMYGSLAAGDIDGNGDMELVWAGYYWFAVGVLSHTGSWQSPWPRGVDCKVYGSPALAELDGDGKLDIVVGTVSGEYEDSASVYVFSHNGSFRPGWPKKFKGDFASSPVVGDIDGDSEADIVVPATNGSIYAWHKDGSLVAGWPRFLIYTFYATPALGDLDDDGDIEIVVCGYDGLVHVFDASAPNDDATMEWPKLCHDLYNSSLYHGPSKAGTPHRGRDEVPGRLVLSGYPNPAFACVNIRLGIPSTRDLENVSVDIYDVRGRHVKQVHDGLLEPGFHEVQWTGRDKRDMRVASGIYFVKVTHNAKSVSSKIVLVR